MKPVFTIVAILLVAFACTDRHPEFRGVTYTNTTNETLKVKFHQTIFVLRGRESLEFGEYETAFDGHSITAYDEDGMLRFQETLTWEQLKARGFKVKIFENVSTDR